MARAALGNEAGDELERIGGTRVLGYRVVVKVDLSRARVHHGVLDNRTEADGGPDLGLLLLREVDALRVATSFEVEDAVSRPAVLVVPDQTAGGIRRQSGFARSRQPEEESNVPSLADVRRAVHREDTLYRIQIVRRGKDRLLHLACVLRSA